MRKNIKTEIIQSVFVVQITSNKLVNANTEGFKSAMDENIPGNHDILIDLSRVEYIDSSGLGSLLHCLRNINAAKGRLKICGVTRPILSLFELIHLDQVFEIHSTQEEALAAFRVPDSEKGNKP